MYISESYQQLNELILLVIGCSTVITSANE